MRSANPVFAALAAIVAVAVVGPGCKGKPDVGLAITLPSAVVPDTVWFEIGAYRDASCGALAPMLLNGVPEGASTRVAFRRDAPQSPRIGDLDTGKYAFAAVARGDDCAVLATGCLEAEMGKADTVSIDMTAVDTPSGACGAGASCQAARCVPANDNADPSVGSQCSLELLGAGPLANPVGGGGTLVSAPAIATTPSGFVIVYREIDSGGASARVTVLPIDPAGGALAATRPLLKGRCANSDETDGVGLVVNGTDGQIVLARSACGARPGLELLSFSSKPDITIDPNFRSSDSQTATTLALSGGHVAATRAGGSIVVFTEDGASRIATIVPGTGVASPSGSFGGTTGVTGAWAAASDKVLALLSAGPNAAAAPVGDGGAEAGTSTGDDTGPSLSLVMAPPTTAADTFSAINETPRAPIVFPGVWGAVAALGTRVIVMSDGGGPGRSVSYRAFDLGKTTASETNGFSIEGTGSPTTGDVTMLGNKAYFAALKPGSVSLHVYDNASTTPTLLRESLFNKETRIPSVTTVRDGRVAVAATTSRVAVVWTSAKVLTNNDATGGYAVFACTP
ncbi:MAG: hypothetical protein JWO86_7815 [Myxococcaceae bacterium]|jgi:hypothetical protein|nr:hypothetical protein [Myxococcaceae bacterium]MEA2751792.1 hypothetical protein [Myxococcales bacterium]